MKNEKGPGEKNIPDILPANVSDWINYAARYGNSNCQIHAVLEFGGILDAARLALAVRLSVDIEPVLGCRFIESKRHPYWQRIADLESIQWCSLEETLDKAAALHNFLGKPFDLDHDPQVLVKLIRSGARDVMCIKMNHSCCDGGGLKEYLELLAGIYTGLGGRGFEAKPNLTGKRDLSPLFTKLGIVDLRSAWNPTPYSQKPAWAFPWHPGQPQRPQFSVSRLSSRNFLSISTYAGKKRASLNDLILTAFIRALFQMAEPAPGNPMEVLLTVDLRRYLPGGRAGALCNLSGLTSVEIPEIPSETFEATLSRVVSLKLKGIRKSRPGVHGAIGIELLGALSFREALRLLKGSRQKAVISGKCSPTLSDLGIISRSPLQFGGIAVEDAYGFSPAFHAPEFMLLTSSYNQLLTFTVSYYEPTTRREDVEQLLSLLTSDLILL